eukprot:gene652-8154_t
MFKTVPQINLPKEDIEDIYDEEEEDDIEEVPMDDEIKEELKILKKELNYFLTEIVPFEWTTIKTELQFALNLLGGHTNADFFGEVGNGGAVFEHVSFVIGETSKGFIYLQGYKIINGKINIRLQKYNQGKLIETKIMNEDPIVIQQIQRCHNFTESAVQKISEFEIRSIDENSLDSILAVVEDCMSSIQQSSEQLRFGDSVFNSKAYSTTIAQMQKNFHPSLSNDVLLDFSLDDNRLKINVRGITFSNQIPKIRTTENHLKPPELILNENGIIGYFSEDHSCHLDLSKDVSV